MPLMLPTLGVALVLSVTYTWGDYMFTMVFGGPYYPTITMLYHNLVDSRYGVAEYNVQMAATILTGAVPLLVYFLCGRLFMRGVAVGVAPPR
jgi:glucose/mannose transport system permease protein